MGLEYSDLVLIIGCNPRFEAPLINARLRKCWIHNELDIAMVGEKVDLTYDYEHLGDDVSILKNILSGTHEFSQRLKDAKNPLIILGTECLQREDGAKIMEITKNIAAGAVVGKESVVEPFNILHRRASQVAALDLGYEPGVKSIKNAEPKVLFLLGADDAAISRADLPSDCVIIYLGHHGDAGASIADVVLPGAAYTEKQGTYANMEGRAQQTRPAVMPPSLARQDWRVLRAISEVCGVTLGYDNMDELRARMSLVSPNLVRHNTMQQPLWNASEIAKQVIELNSCNDDLDTEACFKVSIPLLKDYYMTDSISRASQTMAKCVKAMSAKEE